MLEGGLWAIIEGPLRCVCGVRCCGVCVCVLRRVMDVGGSRVRVNLAIGADVSAVCSHVG